MVAALHDGGDGRPLFSAAARTLAVPTVALGPGHTIAGQVVDARGEPLAGVAVQALPRPVLDEALPWRTRSDEEGRFEFTTLPYGPVSLRGIKHRHQIGSP